MATPNTPYIPTSDSQRGVLAFYQKASEAFKANWDFRTRFEMADKAYMREQDKTTEQSRAKAANNAGDSNRFQNITVPIVLPQVESAVVYQSSVFLTGHPIFQAVASAAYQDEATQMTAKIEADSIQGSWAAEIMQHLRNGAKYNIAAMEVCWEAIKLPSFDTDVTRQEASIKEVMWEGNVLRNMDMYNTFWDTRVAPSEVATLGEFAGYTKYYGRAAFKEYVQKLPFHFNLREALESSLHAAEKGVRYCIPQINPAVMDPSLRTNKEGMDWMAWASASNSETRIAYRNGYELTVLYARIIPSDFKLLTANKNTVQIWKFIIVNHSVVIYAERQTNAHNMLPILFSQPNADGLSYQTKSLLENVLPFQQFTSAAWNSVIAARRRAISDRGIYDPSRIDKKHVENVAANAKIPVKPSAYGKPLSEAYYPIPFRDDQSSTLIQESNLIIAMADQVTGRNQVRQGQFVKGNKTQREFDTVMGNANGRDQTTSLLYEAQLFTPLKQIIRYNILQYAGPSEIYDRDANKIVEIDPVKLRKAVLEFKMADGLLPVDKLISSEALQVAIQALASSPALQQGYNVPQLFSYLLKTQNAAIKDFEKPKEQLAYEQALASWQQVAMTAAQAGNQQFPPQPKPEDYGYNPQAEGVPQ